MENQEIQRMRKTNMKIFPTYKKMAWDYLFYHSIDFLFLTQIKNISAADVVLLNSIKALCGIFIQIPANVIVEFLGRKNSIILGNILNCLYMVMFIASGSLFDLFIAKFISSFAISIKEIAEPGLLNASIPPSKYKGNIFAKINAKGVSGYYMLSATSKIIAGFLFNINGYIPFICSLAVLVIVTIMSLFYIEPVQKQKNKKSENTVKKQIKDIREGFSYILKSERLKALILPTSLIASLLTITASYRTSLMKDINLSASIIGIVSAVLSFSSAYGSKKQNEFHNKFRNKSIITLALINSICMIIAGVAGIKANEYRVLIVIIILSFIIGKITHGLFYTLTDRYFRNFTNKDIDTKVFAGKSLFVNIVSAVMGILSSFVLDKTSTANAMIIVGVAFTIMYILTAIYMKSRVGLKPEQYSKEERKYDELREEK